jgi:hypothetical protein
VYLSSFAHSLSHVDSLGVFRCCLPTGVLYFDGGEHVTSIVPSSPPFTHRYGSMSELGRRSNHVMPTTRSQNHGFKRERESLHTAKGSGSFSSILDQPKCLLFMKTARPASSHEVGGGGVVYPIAACCCVAAWSCVIVVHLSSWS